MKASEVAREARAPLSTVRHWLGTGYLPSVKLGKHRLVSRADFERLVRSGSQGADIPSPDSVSQAAFDELRREVHELVAVVVALNVRVRELMSEKVQAGRLEPGVYRGKHKGMPGRR